MRAPQSAKRGHRLVLAAAAIALAAASVPSPLYDVWREDMGFGVGVQGIVFGVYAVALIPALLAGSVLAGKGRGAALLGTGLVLSLLADLLFVGASSVGSLIAARAVQGVSVGLVSAAANMLVVQLGPRTDQRRASIATAVAVAAGLAAGALGSGLLAEYAAAPTRTVFVLHALLVVGVLVATAALRRSTASPAAPRLGAADSAAAPWSPAVFALCCASVMAAWAAAAMFLAVGPSYALELLGTGNRAVAGATTAALFALACVVEIRSARRTDARNLALGLFGLAIGAVATALAFPAHSVAVLAVGALFCGCGLGLVFVSTLAIVNAIVPEQRRAALLAVFFALLFLANSLPVVAVGFLADAVGLPAAVTGFAVAVVLVVLVLLFLLAWSGINRHLRPQSGGRPRRHRVRRAVRRRAPATSRTPIRRRPVPGAP